MVVSKKLLPNYRHTEVHHPHHGVAPKPLQSVTIRYHHHLLLRSHHHHPFDSCMEAKPSRDFSAIDSTSGLLALLDLKELQRHQHTHMEEMDLDSLEVVLDTPERSTAQRGQKCEHDIEVHSSNSRSSKLLEKPNRQTMGNHRRLSITNGGNKPLFRSMGGFRIGNEAEKNMHPTVTLIDSSPTVHAPTSSDKTKLDGSSSAFTEVLTSDDKIQGRKKENIDDLMSSQNVFSTSLHPCGKRTMRRKPVIHGNTSFGNSVPVDVEGSHIVSNTNQETEMNMFKPQQSFALPTITRHRRLVRNGCISPHNIAKAKHIAESEGKSSTNSKQDDIHQVFSNTIPTSKGNDTHKENQVKGKGLVIEMSPAQEYGAEPILPSTRSSQNTNKDANKIEDASGVASRSFEGISGWRSTRNRSNKTSFAMSDENLGRTSSDARHFNEAGDPVSFQHVPTEESVHGSSCTNSGLGVENGQHHAAHKLGKRQRRAPASSNLGQCSSSSLEDLEVALLCPPEEALHARSSTSRNNHHNHRPALVIDIDELSPEVRRRSPQSTTQRVNDDSDDRARQVEADEMLARELQEQFYGLPEIGGGEIDASLARYLQQEEERQRATVRGRQHVDSRDSSLSHLYRQYQFQNSIVRSRNNANHARVPTSTRRARLRDRFSSHSPRVPSTTIPRGFQFPPNMDVEMRMHVLEVLEAAVGENDDMAHLFQGHRDFNENDYEMLLALDEGIHQNRGASDAQINGLPQSTVQSDNFDEVCAICLETPTIGDTIRHLPCLHKFHKDCIDPWLNRRTSCPVCKSDIT